jgi:hypothetical protein
LPLADISLGGNSQCGSHLPANLSRKASGGWLERVAFLPEIIREANEGSQSNPIECIRLHMIVFGPLQLKAGRSMI